MEKSLVDEEAKVDLDSVLLEENSLKHALVEFYKIFNKDRVDTIDDILDKYKGNEVELLNNLMTKYDVHDYKVFHEHIERMNKNNIIAQSENNVSNVIPQASSKTERVLDITPTKDAMNKAPAGLVTLTDLSSRLFTSWGINTGESVTASTAPISTAASSAKYHRQPPTNMPSSPFTTGGVTSVSEDQTNTRLTNLQTELQTIRSEKNKMEVDLKSLSTQINSMKKENTTLRNENLELKSRLDIMFSAANNSSKETPQSGNMSDIMREHERTRNDLTERVVAAETQIANKHAQLLETIQLNQRLEAQMRYLAIHAFSSFSLDNSLAKTSLDESEEQCTSVVVDTASSKDYAAIIASMPEIQTALDSTSSQHHNPATMCATSDVVSTDPTTENSSSQTSAELISEIEVLKKHIQILQTSYECSRIEFKLEVVQRAVAEDRVIEQQLEIERLENKLSRTDTELETASGSADTLKQQISEAVAESTYYKTLIAQSDEKLVAKDEEISRLQLEINRLEETLSVSDQARADLSTICAERIRDTNTKASDYVRSMKESVLLEREDMLTKLMSTALLSDDLRLSVSFETQKELQRLRDELFKARRNETQKEREIAFLQRQLVDAAKKIAQESVEKEQLLLERNSSANISSAGRHSQYTYQQQQQQQQLHYSSNSNSQQQQSYEGEYEV